MSLLTFLCHGLDLDPADMSDPPAQPTPEPPSATPASDITPDGYRVAYAYQPRQGANSRGTNHLIAVQAIDVGRLHRKAGDPLCRPARTFWGLDGRSSSDFEANPCQRCAEIRARLAKTKEGER